MSLPFAQLPLLFTTSWNHLISQSISQSIKCICKALFYISSCHKVLSFQYCLMITHPSKVSLPITATDSATKTSSTFIVPNTVEPHTLPSTFLPWFVSWCYLQVFCRFPQRLWCNTDGMYLWSRFSEVWWKWTRLSSSYPPIPFT